MSPERWRQIEELYHAALELDPASRTQFLAQAAATDEELRREVESLLAQNTSDQNLLDCHPWQYPGTTATDKLPLHGRFAEPEPATPEPGSDLENRFAPGTMLGLAIA